MSRGRLIAILDGAIVMKNWGDAVNNALLSIVTSIVMMDAVVSGRRKRGRKCVTKCRWLHRLLVLLLLSSATGCSVKRQRLRRRVKCHSTRRHGSYRRRHRVARRGSRQRGRRRAIYMLWRPIVTSVLVRVRMVLVLMVMRQVVGVVAGTTARIRADFHRL